MGMGGRERKKGGGGKRKRKRDNSQLKEKKDLKENGESADHLFGGGVLVGPTHRHC